MDAYDLGIKQRPCPAAAVNTTNWFFAIAYEQNHPTEFGTRDGGDYFCNYGEIGSSSYRLDITPATSLPGLFNQYGYNVTKCYFYARNDSRLGGNGFANYNGSIQISSWVSFSSALNGTSNIFKFHTGGEDCPAFYLVNKGSGLASLRVTQPYSYQTTPYTVESSSFACPTNGTWFYFTIIVNCASGQVLCYIGSTLVATLSTRTWLFDKSDWIAFDGYKRDCIMRKWTTGDTVFTPTRLLALS